MRPLESLRLAALVGLATAGCSSAVNPDKIKPTASAICTEGFSALLAKSAECFHSPPAWIASTGTAPDCAAWDRAVAAGRLRLDPGQLTQCLSDIAAVDCLTLFASASALPGACTQLVVGQVQESGGCYLPDECASGTYCDLGTACPGTCRRYGGPGAACGGGADAWCRSDLACIDNSGTSTCQAYLGANADCSANRLACAPGLVCDTSSTPTPSLKCVTATTGTPCSGPAACPVPGLVCAGYTATTPGTCRVAKSVGAACVVGNRECAYGAYCAGLAAGAPGTCIAYPSTLNASYLCGVVLNELVDCIGGYCAYSAPGTGSCASYVPTSQACDLAYPLDPNVPCGRWSKGYYCDPTAPSVCRYYRCTEP
jgi:hypothetical protein